MGPVPADRVPEGGEQQVALDPRSVKRARRLGLVVGGLIVAIFLVRLVAGAWTQWAWFDSVGFVGVLRTQWITQGVLFVIGALLTGGAVWTSLAVAHRARPVIVPESDEELVMERYRGAFEPIRRRVWMAVPALVGFFGGATAASQWKLALLWLNRVPFGTKDAHFNKDIGFFVFTVPWLSFLVGFLTMVLMLALLGALLAHYLYGGLNFRGAGGGAHSRSPRTSAAARVHLCVLAVALLLVRAGSFWLSRYESTTAAGSRITGVTYTVDHAIIPTRGVLALAALCCAVMFIATIVTGTWRVPLVGVAMMTAVAVLVGQVYPAFVQRFQVKPSEASKETPYIKDAMAATMKAYGLGDIDRRSYSATTDASGGQLRGDTATMRGIRLLDPTVVGATFQQLQGRVNYYRFPASLDVDRYTTNGEKRDTVVAVRGLNLAGVPASQRNWVNDHTVYTHGYGVVAADGGKLTSEGAPVFVEKDMPTNGVLGKYEPRIYFGEDMPGFSIVGGQGARELDHPDASGEQKRTRYAGKGGVALSNPMSRLAYAVTYGDKNILLSDAVGDGSRIIDNRDPSERVKAVAPWLTTDGDVYPSVVDGRVQWIVDGYTTSDNYPGAAKSNLSGATSDSTTATSRNVRALRDGQVNYIRNSVKATVDAYSGEVKLYAWEPNDPMLKAWTKAFGGSVKPMSQMSADLVSHVRYPSDLFKVQRTVLETYHQNDAGEFFNASDQWQVPDDPTAGENAKGQPQPPYYLTLAMPGQKAPSYALTSTYIPVGSRQNLTGYLSVDSDAGSEAGKKASTYGRVRLLEMPGSTSVTGPAQFQNDLDSTTRTSADGSVPLTQFLSQARQSGSTVARGNLLTLPVGGGFLYVEPIYVQARGATSYPLQRAVVVGFGNKLAWAPTLEAALDDLFAGDSGADGAPQPSQDDANSGKDSEKDSGKDSTTKPSTSSNATLDKALKDLQKAYDDGQAAMKKGDWKAYGEAQQRLQKALDSATSAAPSGSVTAK